MKNFFLILAICCLGSISALAQSSTKVVKGAVVDKKNGNPLPGAIVEATGGAESAVVDADGTYSIEVPIWLKSLTARYAGMKSQKKNLNGQEVMFWLSPEKNGQWFINLETSIGSITSIRVGFMGGYLGKWGGYAKLLPTFGYNDDANGVPAGTLGVIKRIASPVYAYLGLGYAPAAYDDGYKDYYWDHGGMFEAGFIFNIKKKINISAGYSYTSDFIDAEHAFHFGVGYCF